MRQEKAIISSRNNKLFDIKMDHKLLFTCCLAMFLFCEIGSGQTIALFKAVDDGTGLVMDKEQNRTLSYNTADTIISGRHIRRARVVTNDYGSQVIEVSLNEEGTERFATVTRQSIGKPVLIMYGEELLAAPIVQSEITGGRLQISGSFTRQEAIKIAEQLNKMPRPVVTKDELKGAVKQLDAALVREDHSALDSLMHEDLLMGHSNAYFQTKEEVINDLRRRKIVYRSIEQLSIQNINEQGEQIRINRVINVKGSYMGTDFAMRLALMEIWLDRDAGMQLWSRQAVKINE